MSEPLVDKQSQKRLTESHVFTPVHEMRDLYAYSWGERACFEKKSGNSIKFNDLLYFIDLSRDTELFMNGNQKSRHA